MAKKTAFLGCALGLAVICGYVELLIPFDFGIPGIKLGLANIVALWLLYRNGLLTALGVNTARILICGILFGNALSVVYSLCGGLAAVCVMYFFKKIPFFSEVGVSVAGATAHNLGQIAAALPTIGFAAARYYLPFITLSGVFTGILIGIAVHYLLKRTDKSLYRF